MAHINYNGFFHRGNINTGEYEPTSFSGCKPNTTFVFFFALASFIIFSVKKRHPGKKDIVIILIGCLVLNLASLLLHYQRLSGEEVVSGYGWPHDVYISRFSNNQSESRTFFTLHYLLANIIFYTSILFLGVSIFKKKK
jgi:hypothetical protein